MERFVVVDTKSQYKTKDVYEALEYIAQAGFKAYDLTLAWDTCSNSLGIREDYVEEVNKLKAHADKLGLVCRQSHAFYTRGLSEEIMEKRFKIISQDLKITKMFGGNICVSHPMWQYDEDSNVEFIKRFIPLLHELDIYLALENVWGSDEFNQPAIMCSSTPENFISLLNKINDDHVVACVDIGHAEMRNMKTSACALLKALGNKVKTLHIHDNDKISDLHQIPFTQNIDFDEVLKTLKEINYQGDIVFEVERCYQKLPKELYVPTLKYLKEIGEYFKSKIEN